MRPTLGILLAYAAIILVGASAMAAMQVAFEFTDPPWKRTINDVVHILWGIALTWTWLLLYKSHILRTENRQAQDCLRRSQEMLERATQMNQDTQRMLSGHGHTEIDVEI